MYKIVLLTMFLIPICSLSLEINLSYEDKQTYPFVMGFDALIPDRLPGVTIEVLRAIESEIGVKFIFKREQGIRGQKSLETNRADMLLFASYAKEREAIGVYPMLKESKVDESRKAMDLSYMLYTHRDSNLSFDGENFINLDGAIGATKGYSIVAFLKAKGVEVQENTSNLGDPKKLLAGRIVGFANQDSKIDPYLKENPTLAKKIKKIPTPLQSKPYYILFSHKFYSEHKDIAQKIWDATANHIDNKKFRHIVDKYK